MREIDNSCIRIDCMNRKYILIDREREGVIRNHFDRSHLTNVFMAWIFFPWAEDSEEEFKRCVDRPNDKVIQYHLHSKA